MTLMEVLITVSMIALITGGLYNALANGIRVWRRAQQTMVEQQAQLFFDRMTHDLRNAFYHKLIPHEGSESRLSIPTMVIVEADPYGLRKDEGYVQQIGRVEYYLDLNKRAIMRRTARYSHAVENDFADPVEVLADVQLLRLRYIYLTPEGEWHSEALMDVLPATVSVDITFTGSQDGLRMKRLIDLPLEG